MGNSEAKKKKQEEDELKELEAKQKNISIAVLFLGGKDMDKVSDLQKKIFLRKKGLSEEMVTEAFKRYNQKIQKQKSNPPILETAPTLLTTPIVPNKT